MATQAETLLVGHPFTCLMEARGWICKKTHGNQFQAGFPDYYCVHPQFSARWIECKVLRDGTYSFTDAQKKYFPILAKCKVPVYIIAGTDLRGEGAYEERKRLYELLFKEPNVMQCLDSWRRK